MKVEKIITTTQTEELELTDATLLSVEEANALPERLRVFTDWWWLRSPGGLQYSAAGVFSGGSVGYYGNLVNNVSGCVRPALSISNLESSNLKIGDTFIFGEKDFEIVSDTLAFCKSDIGQHCFREDWRADDANDYEKSDIKKFVDEWFERSKK